MNKARIERLVEVADERRKADARELRAALFGRCRAACDQLGDEIVGFALVVWDRQGDMRTAYASFFEKAFVSLVMRR